MGRYVPRARSQVEAAISAAPPPNVSSAATVKLPASQKHRPRAGKRRHDPGRDAHDQSAVEEVAQHLRVQHDARRVDRLRVPCQQVDRRHEPVLEPEDAAQQDRLAAEGAPEFRRVSGLLPLQHLVQRHVIECLARGEVDEAVLGGPAEPRRHLARQRRHRAAADLDALVEAPHHAVAVDRQQRVAGRVPPSRGEDEPLVDRPRLAGRIDGQRQHQRDRAPRGHDPRSKWRS